MTITVPDSTLTAVRVQASEAWQVFTSNRNMPTTLTDWTETVTPDGHPALTAMAVGLAADRTLRIFTADCHIPLAWPGDTRPAFDYSVPGRTSCVWRSRGVWVELWVPDVPIAPVAPVRPVRRRLLTRPGGRLPFTRRDKAKKEATTA